ncbi:MAG: hypothetical protein ACJA13_003627 [Paraglaciecola sp.]|jgi:hypothetical protein
MVAASFFPVVNGHDLDSFLSYKNVSHQFGLAFTFTEYEIEPLRGIVPKTFLLLIIKDSDRHFCDDELHELAFPGLADLIDELKTHS